VEGGRDAAHDHELNVVVVKLVQNVEEVARHGTAAA
jgi:hypothetical protein